MDLSDITKLANRKRVNADAENLRKKVSQEAANIIKLRVGQDTSYWELKEKLGDVEREHARLQQNMVDMQMQHEALSAQYQEELRLRPETLNKVASTREICDVLEEYMSRLSGTLQRCAADKRALGEAYARASTAVATTRDDIERGVNGVMLQARAECDQLRASVEQSARLANTAETARRHSEMAAEGARAHLADISDEAERLRDQRDNLTAQIAARDATLQERERTITELRDEIVQVAVDSSVKTERMKTVLFDLERETCAVAELREALKAAETRGEQAASEAASVRVALAASEARGESEAREAARLREALDAAEARGESEATRLREALDTAEARGAAAASDVARLREALAAVTTDRDAAVATVATLDRQWQESMALTNELKHKLEDLLKHNRTLLNEIDDNNQIIEALKNRAEKVEQERDEHSAEEARLSSALATQSCELRDVTTERDVARDEAKRAAADATSLAAECKATGEQLEKLRAESAEAASAAERNQAERADTIARLMRDVTQETEARTRTETTLAATRLELETTRLELETTRLELGTARADCLRAKEDVRRLDAAVRSKDQETADQMKIILETRSEKERLHEKIRGMQGTIDNIQKELERPPPLSSTSATSRNPPEHDDNALPAPPTPRNHQKPQKEVFAKPMKRNFAPTESLPMDSLFFNFLSDSSMESDALDPTEVTRRFEALTRAVASSAPPRPPHGRHAADQTTAAPAPAPVSLSQMREVQSARSRTFFKNKRSDAKTKKQK